ncbi:Glycosyltransferase [Acidisarcina polymorpha]|uniref:Glycosyltransferase n=1 Tax=Acidisarcina polymorpha TaxID=2211140 RepID=A0A2Z5G682_9BACT|nr:glycosyltransferase family 4 protein [Acidisarcina polymorpha]AXC14611.1 Glycosyltransferase [Acidisarcina polymorpha]
MRVLLTTDTIGGVWTYTRELTEGLLRASVAVALVSFGRLPSEDQLAWCHTVAGRHPALFEYHFSDTPLEWMSDNECVYELGVPLLQRVAREFRADLLHSNQYCFGRFPHGIPRLVTAHSDVISWSKACTSEALEPGRWITTYKTLVQEGLLAADTLVAPTRWMLDALTSTFQVPRRILVVGNGRTISSRRRSTARSMQAVSVGRLWDPAKNLSLLSSLPASVPIFVAGEQRYGEAGIPGLVETFTSLGPLSEEAVLSLFRSSSIYLCTSIYEPFGLAPLEAALCGCAVLANDIPSLREVWGDAARYFADAPTLSFLLEELISNPEELRRCQKQSLRRAQHWTAQRMTSGYMSIYRSLLARGSSASSISRIAEGDLCVA